MPASPPGPPWRDMASAPRDSRWFAVLLPTDHDVVGGSPWWIGTARFENPSDPHPELMAADGHFGAEVRPAAWAPLEALSPQG